MAWGSEDIGTAAERAVLRKTLMKDLYTRISQKSDQAGTDRPPRPRHPRSHRCCCQKMRIELDLPTRHKSSALAGLSDETEGCKMHNKQKNEVPVKWG